MTQVTPEQLQQEIAELVQSRLPQDMRNKVRVDVQVEVRYSETPGVNVQLSLPPADRVPEEFWRDAIAAIPESMKELRVVLTILRDSLNIPHTLQDLSKYAEDLTDKKLTIDKISRLNWYLRQAQGGSNPCFLMSRSQKKLGPSEEPLYHIRKRRA